MDNLTYSLEEASNKTGIPVETLKTRIKRGKLSAIKAPFGNKRYEWRITKAVLDGLLIKEDDTLWLKLKEQYLTEIKAGIITGKPVSPKYIEITEYCFGRYWVSSGLQKTLKNISYDGLKASLSYYVIDEVNRRDYYSTRSNIYKAITGFMRLLIRDGYKSRDDLEVMKTLKPGKRFSLKKEACEPNVVKQAIEANEAWTHGRKDFDRKLLSTLIALYAYAGLRKMEPAMLTMDKIFLEQGFMLVYGKGGKEDTVLILPELEPILKEWLTYRHSGPFLMTSYDGSPLTATCIQNRLQRLQKETKIKLRAHDLRRTFATVAAVKGMPTPLIQKQFRHSKITTTEGYMMLEDKHLLAWGRQQVVEPEKSNEPEPKKGKVGVAKQNYGMDPI